VFIEGFGGRFLRTAHPIVSYFSENPAEFCTAFQQINPAY